MSITSFIREDTCRGIPRQERSRQGAQLTSYFYTSWLSTITSFERTFPCARRSTVFGFFFKSALQLRSENYPRKSWFTPNSWRNNAVDELWKHRPVKIDTGVLPQKGARRFRFRQNFSVYYRVAGQPSGPVTPLISLLPKYLSLVDILKSTEKEWPQLKIPGGRGRTWPFRRSCSICSFGVYILGFLLQDGMYSDVLLLDLVADILIGTCRHQIQSWRH